MNDEACVDFLQWCLPRLGKRWAGFHKVRSQGCKRIARRMQDLGLRSLDTYRDYLNAHRDEWNHLDAMCRITISRFYRDRGVFDAALQRMCLGRLVDRLAPGGVLVLGKHETLPDGDWPLDPWDAHKRIFRHVRGKERGS